MKINLNHVPAIPVTLKSLDEGMKWKYSLKEIEKGDLVLNTCNEWAESASNCYSSFRIVATQTPIKKSLKKTLKELNLPKPPKVAGYKLKYAGFKVKGLEEFFLYCEFNGTWVRGGGISQGSGDSHYIELIPTKKLTRALKKLKKVISTKEKLNSKISKLTNNSVR